MLNTGLQWVDLATLVFLFLMVSLLWSGARASYIKGILYFGKIIKHRADSCGASKMLQQELRDIQRRLDRIEKQLDKTHG
jgi:hypothetical protein